MINSVIWLTFGEMTWFLRFLVGLDFIIRPPTLSTPLASGYGSKVLRLLVFFKTAFLSLSQWRSWCTPSFWAWNCFNLYTSLWKTLACTSLRITTCACSRSLSMIEGELWPSQLRLLTWGPLSARGSLSALMVLILKRCFYSKQMAIGVFKRGQLENLSNLPDMFPPSSFTVVQAVTFLTSGEVWSTSFSYSPCRGHWPSVCHKKFGPLIYYRTTDTDLLIKSYWYGVTDTKQVMRSYSYEASGVESVTRSFR